MTDTTPDTKERVARWMIANSYATGHGDTVEDMLQELHEQAKERGVRATLDAFANATALDGRKEYDNQWARGFEMCRQRATFAIWELLPGGRP